MSELHTRTESFELLGLKANQFDHLIRSLDMEPSMRTGSKYSVVLYSDQQLYEIQFAMQLRKSKYKFHTIKKIIRLARETDYSCDLWLAAPEGSNEFIVCTENQLPEVTSKISKINNHFFCGKIEIVKPDFTKNLLIGQLQAA
jgi:hypothetical protein